MTLSWLYAMDAPGSDNHGHRLSNSTRPIGNKSSSGELVGEDAAIVTAIRSGGDIAFEQLFLSYHKRLWAFAYDLMHSDDEAEDVVQDVFASLWSRRKSWEVQSSISAYLFGAVRNSVYKRRRHLGLVGKIAKTFADDEASPGMGSSNIDNLTNAEARDITAHIEALIERMPPGRREAILLRWREQLSYEEIAQIMGTSSKAVSVQIARARQDLKPLLPELKAT